MNYNFNNNTNPNISLVINQKDTKCLKHFFEYKFYCYDCKQNLCKICNNEHLNHNEIELDSINPQTYEINSYKEIINNYRNIIDKLDVYKLEVYSKSYSNGEKLIQMIRDEVF